MTAAGQAPRLREAVRAVVLDPGGRILLVRFQDPDTGRSIWATPGGGIGVGEQPEEALRRELREEAGLEGFELGPLIWTRRHVLTWAGKAIDARESFFLVRVPAFDPRPALGVEGLAAEWVHEHRWWTMAEIEASSALFAPRRLVGLLRALVEEGPPVSPIDAGV